VQLLLPQEVSGELARVPTEEAEQSGVGQAVGGVVGGALGASAGLGLGTAVASVLVPGVGAVTAIGLAAAALFGAGGALGGAAAGGALEEKTRHGLPKDELYLYEDALAHGRSVVFAMPESEEEAETARRVLENTGAESLDKAREAWWVGLRDAEKAHYETSEKDFSSVETHYRRGFVAALHPDTRGIPYEKARALLRDRAGDVVDHDAFRLGYERASARARRPEPAGR
jgi:hypothetical protein